MDGLSESAWKDIKHQFYYTGRLPKDISPTLPIIEAWKQSKQAGLSPFSEVTSLKKFKIHSFSDHDVKLAQLAESILADILELFGQQEVSTFLINRDFKIIAERHNPFLDQAYHFLQPGRVVEHSVFGAIAPTCSILSKQPMIMVGHQHYLNEFSNYSCASVPIFNGTGEVVGALDITSPKGLLASNWLRHLLYQSYILENKIIMSELKSDERVLYFQHSKDLLENAYSGLIVLNEKNIVIKANRMALKLLNCSVEQLLNHHFSDYFYCHDISHLKFNEPFLIQSQDHAFLYAKIKQVYNKPNLNYSTTSMFDQALKALKADIPLLITGETGVGKDHFAQQLHQSLDKNIPFISINCGAIPDQLLEAELFGHEGGAFTGAKKHGEKGLIELADQGILFLDEIGDLPLALQVKILRVLQDQQFYRVGGRKPIRSAFRLICATHQDLSARIAEKDFRSDLYYRIRGFEVHVQPLRLRHDKYQVFHQILRSLNITQWSAQVETQFENYSWPGNIRELIHVLKLSFAFNQGDILEVLHLPQPILNTLEVSNSPQCLSAPSNLTDKTKVFILQVLQEENGNIARTAKRLKISRTTIYKYLDS